MGWIWKGSCSYWGHQVEGRPCKKLFLARQQQSLSLLKHQPTTWKSAILARYFGIETRQEID